VVIANDIKTLKQISFSHSQFDTTNRHGLRALPAIEIQVRVRVN